MANEKVEIPNRRDLLQQWIDNGDGSYSPQVTLGGGGGGSTVDTELPAAAALAAGMANPTAPAVGAFGMVYNGTTWDRVRTASADALAATGLLANGNMVWNGTAWDRMANPENATASLRVPGVGMMVRSSASAYDPVISLAVASDAGSNANRGPIVHHVHFNGTTYDRTRNNMEGQVLASAARTASAGAVTINNYNARAFYVILNITAFAATPTLTLTISGVDSVSSVEYTLLAGAAINVAGASTVIYKVGPGLTAVANLVANEFIPRTLRVIVAHGDADSCTYSVGYALMMA